MKRVILILVTTSLLSTAKSQCIVTDAKHKNRFHLVFDSKYKIKNAAFTLKDSAGAVLLTRSTFVRKGLNDTWLEAKYLAPGLQYQVSISNVFFSTFSKSL